MTTGNTMYDRQARIEGINTDIKVAVIGCGGIGFHVAKSLAISGVPVIHAFDFDTIEESNLARLDIPADFIGRNKADVVKSEIKRLRPMCNVKGYPFPLKEHTYPRGVDWVVDCTDNLASQIKNEAMAKANGAKYVKAGYDGERMALSNAVGKWDTGNSGEEGGYTITPSWIVPATIIAQLCVGKVLKYGDKEMGCHLSELFD